jgi:hypothetical protein
MYKILGSDGNEYGPVSAEQVKKWIAENRVEKKTPVIPEGGADWVFLGSLPEFAADFALPPSVPPPKSAPPVPLPAAAPKTADRPEDDKPEKQGEQDVTHDPRENSRAWMAYCLGVISVVPPFGALVGIPALILGILGLRFLRRNPEVGGRFHAWMGIILGGVFGLGYWVLIALVIIEGVVHPQLMR